VLDGVLDQVRHDLPEPPRVAAHRRERRSDLREHRHLVLADDGSGDSFVHDRPQLDVGEREGEGPRVDA